MIKIRECVRRLPPYITKVEYMIVRDTLIGLSSNYWSKPKIERHFLCYPCLVLSMQYYFLLNPSEFNDINHFNLKLHNKSEILCYKWSMVNRTFNVTYLNPYFNSLQSSIFFKYPFPPHTLPPPPKKCDSYIPIFHCEIHVHELFSFIFDFVLFLLTC